MKKEEAIELLEDLYGAIEDNHGRDYDEAFRMAIEALLDDVVQGEWRCMADYGIPECDQCGFATEHKFNYCPNCGAYMKGADDE